MEFEQVVKLIKAVSDSSLTSFQYEEEGLKLSMQTEQVQIMTSGQSTPATMPIQSFAETEKEKTTTTEKVIKSPLVGTFYTAAAEDAEPFAVVGNVVKKGQTLAIIEAMKLMNDIECEFDGVIVEIYAENGDVVEYGQPLFCIA